MFAAVTGQCPGGSRPARRVPCAHTRHAEKDTPGRGGHARTVDFGVRAVGRRRGNRVRRSGDRADDGRDSRRGPGPFQKNDDVPVHADTAADRAGIRADRVGQPQDDGHVGADDQQHGPERGHHHDRAEPGVRAPARGQVRQPRLQSSAASARPVPAGTAGATGAAGRHRRTGRTTTGVVAVMVGRDGDVGPPPPPQKKDRVVVVRCRPLIFASIDSCNYL